MPQKAKFTLPPLNLGGETTGVRIARLRKERGYTQGELAEKIGISQKLISAYEIGRLGLSAEMITRIAMALEVPSDELLGLSGQKTAVNKPSLKILRRLSKIEALPGNQQKTLLNTIDTFLKGARK